MIYLQAGGADLIGSMWPILLMFVVIYFFMIRPQAKKQKEQKKFIESIEKGDEVATTSGMIGKVNKVEDNIIQLQVDTKTFIRVARSAISKEMTDAVKDTRD